MARQPRAYRAGEVTDRALALEPRAQERRSAQVRPGSASITRTRWMSTPTARDIGRPIAPSDSSRYPQVYGIDAIMKSEHLDALRSLGALGALLSARPAIPRSWCLWDGAGIAVSPHFPRDSTPGLHRLGSASAGSACSEPAAHRTRVTRSEQVTRKRIPPAATPVAYCGAVRRS